MANYRIKTKYVPEIYVFYQSHPFGGKKKKKNQTEKTNYQWHAAYLQMPVIPFIYKINEPMI